MSERRLRTAPNPTTMGISKRSRKSSVRPTEDDKQKERKRALDRKAQRISREKTRSHIAQLEKTVQILSENHGTAATNELLEENTRLHAEIDRLRKIIDNIRSVLGVDVLGTMDPTTPQRQSPETKLNFQIDLDQPMPCEIGSPSEQFPTLQHQIPDNWEGGSLDEIGTEVGQGVSENSMETDSNNTRKIYNLGDGIDESALALTSRWDGKESPVFEHALLRLVCPLKTGMSEPPMTEFLPCRIWQKANAIYANIFNYSKERRREADKVEAGSLIKVIKGGWGSLSLKERGNPVLQILKEVDQNLFWDLDPVTKIANLYKSLLLLKYYFNSETENLNRMPDWQRPVQSQRVRQHPIPIDFFPWPALRDRLVRHHSYYFATTEFSIQYRLHFKFIWPYGFDDTYKFDPQTGQYAISPLFDQYHRDMRCWSLEPIFFQKFPELIGEISVYESEGDACSRSLLDSILKPRSIAETTSGATKGSFDDASVMELFDECPPT